MPLAYFYSRVSTKRQIDGLGLKRQAEDRDKWIVEHPELNLTVVQDYTDLGVSGRGKNRTEGKLGLIINAIQTGKMPLGSYLIVDSLDRISREELIDAYYLILSIVRAGIVIVTTSDGMTYDRSDRERMMFSLLISLVIVARSSNESEAKSERGLKNWAIKRRAAAEGGNSEKPYTRMTPGWIDYDQEQNRLVLNEHSKTVLRIFELASQGFGTALIVQQLIREERPPIAAGRRKDAGPWSRRYVSLILENRAVLGEFTPGVKNGGTDEKRSLTGQMIENHFPPIPGIHEFWNRVVAIRERRKSLYKSRNRRGDFSNLFAGLCRCSSCNGAMVINHRQAPSKISYLRCPNRYLSKTCSGGSTYHYQRLEGIILDQLEVLLLVPSDLRNDKSEPTEELAKAKMQIADLKRRITNLLDEAEQAGFSEVRDRIALRRSQLQNAEAHLEHLEKERATRQSSLTTEEYVSQITARKIALNSDDLQVRTSARSEIKLKLQALIKSMMFNPDRSVSVHFALPSGHSVCLDIPHQGEPSLSGKINPTTTLIWRNLKGGLETAKRLDVEGLPA